MSWAYPLVPISELVRTVGKWNPCQSATNELFTYIDIASINQETKQVEKAVDLLTHEAPSRARQIVKAGDILVSTVRPNLNAVAHLDNQFEGATASTGFTVLRTKPQKLDSRYLYYWVRTPYFIEDMVRRSTGASYPAVSDSIIKEYGIPLPPLEDQRRIAAILDKADAVRRKRKEAIALREELLRSAFLEMFGDPVTNPKGWEIVHMSQVVNQTQYGTAEKANSEKNGIPVLRMNNITYTGEIKLNDMKWCPIPAADEAKFTLRRGDLLFNRTNSPELVGKTAVWRSDEKYAFAGYLVRVRFKTELALPEYVSAYLNSSYGKKYLLERAKPSINMSNFSASEFMKIPLLLPPINLQKHFVLITETVRSSAKRLEEVVKDADNLFNSLLQRAFRGEL